MSVYRLNVFVASPIQTSGRILRKAWRAFPQFQD